MKAHVYLVSEQWPEVAGFAFCSHTHIYISRSSMRSLSARRIQIQAGGPVHPKGKPSCSLQPFRFWSTDKVRSGETGQFTYVAYRLSFLDTPAPNFEDKVIDTFPGFSRQHEHLLRFLYMALLYKILYTPVPKYVYIVRCDTL
jgi:hypothetical protein